jgi:SAM-dependent methyltransferase
MTKTKDLKWLLWLVTSLVAVLGVGLLSGYYLQQFDENVGFHREADRIAGALNLTSGMNVADVRAGTGKWTADIARRIAPSGQVYATVGPDPPHVLYETIAAARVDNVTVVVRTPGEQSRLPPNCCEAVLMRAVYHEFDDRLRITSDVYQAIRPGGILAIIDFDEGTPEQLSGHGIARETVIAEVTSIGFRLDEVIPDWEGNAYCLLFRRPENPIRNALNASEASEH